MTDRQLAVSDGHDTQTGRFLPGNRAARGNVTPRRTASFRAALFRAVSPSDFRAVVGKLIEQAKSGEPWAVKLALQYLAGRSEDIELTERLMVLERTIKQGR